LVSVVLKGLETKTRYTPLPNDTITNRIHVSDLASVMVRIARARIGGSKELNKVEIWNASDSFPSDRSTLLNYANEKLKVPEAFRAVPLPTRRPRGGGRSWGGDRGDRGDGGTTFPNGKIIDNAKILEHFSPRLILKYPSYMDYIDSISIANLDSVATDE